MLQSNQDQLHSGRKIAIHHRSNFLHIGCEIAECNDLQIPGGGVPIMPYAAHAMHLTRTDIKTMESTHCNIIKSSLGLSKYSRTSPLIASLDTQRVESVINNYKSTAAMLDGGFIGLTIILDTLQTR